MPRKPEIHYWESRGGYYCTFQAEQHRLATGPDDQPDGPTFRAAQTRFQEIVHGIKPGTTLRFLISRHLEWAEHNVQPETAKLKKQSLETFNETLGDRIADTLTVYEVQRLCDQQRTAKGWNDGYIRMKLTAIKACLSWAAEMGLLDTNPLAKLKYPSSGTRGLEVVLSEEDERAILTKAVGKGFAFLQCLRDTGARPGELSRAEARHYDRDLCALVFQANDPDRTKRHKTCKTGRARVIYLTGRSLEIVRELVCRHPTGPLFRSSRRPKGSDKTVCASGWTKSKVTDYVRGLRRKLGLRHFVAYSFRHTFAVRWLRLGKPVAALAEVLGTSIEMIRKHYGHLADQHDYLRRLVEELHASREGG